jgi:hypothetical protein
MVGNHRELVQRLHWRLGLARRSQIARVIFRQIGIISTHRKIRHLNYISAPLGMTFCSFGVLCIPLGMTFELLPGFFPALDGACSNVTFYILLGDFALVELNKKRKITSYGHIKNLSPPLERKRVP